MENQGILQLHRPIKVNGVERTEILYDFDALTTRDVMALGKGRAAMGLGNATSQELDTYAQLALFMRAAIRADSSLDEADLERMSGRDAIRAQRLGRDFFLADMLEEVSEDEDPDTSDESLEI